jgi:hypothetical protein
MIVICVFVSIHHRVEVDGLELFSFNPTVSSLAEMSQNELCMERTVYIQGCSMLIADMPKNENHIRIRHTRAYLYFSIHSCSVYKDKQNTHILRFYFSLFTVWEATLILETPGMAAQMMRRMNGYVSVRTYPLLEGRNRPDCG